MLRLRSIRWLLLHFLVGQLHVHYAVATWPLMNTSTIQLLGLFPDEANGSESETITLSVHSRAMFKAAIVLSQQLNFTVEGQLIGWQVLQTDSTTLGPLISACRIMPTSNIVGIVGPAFSNQAANIATLAGIVGIPAISYGATDPALSNKTIYPAFYRTVPSDYAAALAITKLFIQYNWTSCIIIYQNDDFGTGGADALSEVFDENNLIVSTTLLYDLSTLTFRGDFKNTLLESSSRIVLLWTDIFHTSTILQSALDNDVLGPQFLWILCSTISLNSFNPTFYTQLIGIISIEPTIGTAVGASANTTLLNAAYAIWQQYEPETFPGSTQVHNYAFFAFDATWTLIQSLQRLCSTGIHSSSSCLAVVNSSFCFDQRFLNADAFFNILSTTEFLGVSGPIQFSNTTTDRINGAYFIAQNIQPSSSGVSYASVLQWPGFGNWEAATQASVIIWPGTSLTPPTGVPELFGVTLRIGVSIVAPFTTQTVVIDESGQNTTNLVGYSIDLINILQTSMGFIPQIMLVPSNMTSDQVVEAVAKNVYDIVVSDITITAKRRQIVDFSTSIFDSSFRIIVRQGSSVNIKLLSYMTPFVPVLWLVILGALLYSSVLMVLFEGRQNEALKEKSLVSSVVMSAWFCYATMVGYGADFHVQTAAGRLLTGGLYMVCLVLVASYTASLASDLTLSKSANIISGIDDIKNGKIAFSRIGIVVGSASEDYYLQTISSGSRNYYPLQSQNDIYSNLLNNTIDAAIYDTGLLEYATNTIYCNLTLVGSDFEPSAYGIVMQQEWLYAQAFDETLLALRESGELDTLKQKWFQGGTCSDSSDDTDTSYTIQSLAGLFVVFLVISVLSLLLFAWTNRRIIKDWLWKLAQQKNWVAQQNGSADKVVSENSDESLQTYQLGTDLHSVVHF